MQPACAICTLHKRITDHSGTRYATHTTQHSTRIIGTLRLCLSFVCSRAANKIRRSKLLLRCIDHSTTGFDQVVSGTVCVQHKVDRNGQVCFCFSLSLSLSLSLFSFFTFHIFTTSSHHVTFDSFTHLLRGRGISPRGRGQLQERLRHGPH